ncbi:MAG TPA: hypothetical protein VFD18_00840 [Chthoniobacterales bacterium]|nr:hypothetical protein [Chthoniobacterales bacterium]
MKRFPLLVVVSLITAGAIWFGYYKSRHTSSTTVTSFLPKETLALFHLPDFNRARAEFHQTDLYQIWTEPAVQDFLQKPRAKISANEHLDATLDECEALQIKDAFIALVTVEANAWKMVGGFHFNGDPVNAEKTVANWKSKLIGRGSDFKQETIEYQGHGIQIDTEGLVRIATVRDDQWFFLANDLEQLKLVLDRVDGRTKDPQTTLAADEVFGEASKRMPLVYVALAFARINTLVEKLTSQTARNPNELADQMATLSHIRSLCGATSFLGGKIRDTIFIGMPKLLNAGDLTRASLPIATKDAFLYAAGFLNLTKPLPLPGSQGAIGWIGGLHRITDALASKGITLERWNTAFGPEVSWIGEWPTNAHWPSLFLTLPVKDSTTAKEILNIITTANDNSVPWMHQEKDGVQYFSTRSGQPFFSFSPTIGLSKQLLVAGADSSSVESAMKRSTTGNSGLAASRIFLSAERDVPTARQAFTYIDPALIYTRLDATLRPILFMGAAFLPGISDTVDLNKLPPVEVITNHLTPIVMSQSYDGNGYIAESAGTITLGQAIIGVGGIGGFAGVLYQHQLPKVVKTPAKTPTIPAIGPTPSASTSDSSREGESAESE